MKIVTRLVIVFFVFGMVGAANASTTFPDDFEDGNHDGWLVGSATGTGSTGVELHNSSKMAFATQTGSGTHSLSIDFNYVPDATLSFDMHAIALTAHEPGTTASAQANSGVMVSFLDSLNGELGYMRLINNTSGSYEAHDIAIDGLQHNYSALLSYYAVKAGLSDAYPISKVSLSYWSTGSNVYGAESSSTVWFDNVDVCTIPSL